MDSQKESVTYGSIISFQNDFSSSDETPTLSYDPSNYYTYYLKHKKGDIFDFLTKRYFLYAHGIFNEFCYLYNFKDKNDIKYNYFNTLFMILPSCEYDAMAKFKSLIKDLKNEILMNEIPTVNNFQILDFYVKFKQEIQANLKQSAKLMKTDSNKVNFNDCVQFLHIRTGKFLSYRTYDEYLKTYVELTDKTSKNTIFRFTPAYVYQVENSTNVFFDLTIQIACGDKKTGNEKFISNIDNSKQSLYKESKVIEFGKRLLTWKIKSQLMSSTTNERIENLKLSISNIFFDSNNNNINTKNNLKENFLTFITNSNLAYKNFGKKIFPKDNYIGVNIKSNDYWKLISFSKNFLIDNNFINSLDYFSIQNVEKNICILIDKKKDDDENTTSFINFYEERKGNIRISKPKIDLKIEEQTKMKSESNIKNKKRKSLIEGEKNSEIIGDGGEEENEEVEEEEDEHEIDKELTPEPKNLFNDEYYANLKYDLKANVYEEKDQKFLEPYSLFKFEIININNEKNDFTTIDLLSEDCYIRLISVFFNKAIAIGNKSDLKIIDNVEKDDYRYNSTLFKVEKVKERNKKIIIEKKTVKENDINEKEKKEEKEETTEDCLFTEYITKNDCIKLKSKIGGQYLGIRLNQRKGKESTQLLLTKSISDLTRFKLNFLEDEDKYELHFFEQLLWSLKNLLSFFRQERKIKFISENNYEKMLHILINFEKKIKKFKDNRNLRVGKEQKFNFLKIIEYFDIVPILINLFIANWFNNNENFDYDKLEEKLATYYKIKTNELRYKQIISRKILKILTLIFNLDKSFLDCMANKLIYFFMFVGRDDKCTKFLVHILKDNRLLLISLCPTNLETDMINTEKSDLMSSMSENKEHLSFELYKNLKKCLKRIINDYNHLDIVQLSIYFSSVFLFFQLMNCLLIYNSKPFKPFYDYYFEDLHLLIDEGELFVKPDYINNPILVDFFIKDDTICVRKEKFFQKSSGEIIIENYLEIDEDFIEVHKISNNNKLIENESNIPNNKEQIQFNLIDLIAINNNSYVDKYYRKILFAKLVSLNILFYSNLSLCEPKFKAYLKSLFNIKDVITKYLSYNANVHGSHLNVKNLNNSLNNDLKCSLVQIINYLYFRVPFPFWEKINLFKNVKTKSLKRYKTILESGKKEELDNNIEEEDLNDVISYINEIIDNNINIKGPGIDPFLIFQIFECAKYILRYLYTLKNNESHINTVFNLVGQILKLLDKYIGISKDEKYKGNLGGTLNSILNDQLNLKEEIYIVNDKFQFLFQNLKKKLEITIRNKEVKNLKELFKDLFSKAIAKEDKGSLGNSRARNLKKKSMNKLKKYNLSNILLEISINSNKEQKTILSEIMNMIANIFYEFLQYIESLSIEELGTNLFELKNIYDGNSNKFETIIIEEIIKTNNDNYKEEPKIKESNSLKHKYIEFKESSENKYMNKFKKQWNISDNISNFFFKFLNVIDDNALINVILEIIYRLNNQRKIYYRNVCNYVIFQEEEDFEKFLKIKQLFVSIFENLENIYLLKGLNDTSNKLFIQLKFLLDSLSKKLFEEEKWRHNNNILYSYEEIKLIDDDNNDNTSSDFEIESIKFEENPNSVEKKISTEIKRKSEKNNNKKLGPYLIIDEKENRTIDLLITQQTLFNLGFMTIIDDLFKYIQWVIEENKDELKDGLESMELILISIYKLMVLFIYNNSKHKKLINDKLYLYIYPLKFKNKKQNLLYSIGYFLLNLLYNNETMGFSGPVEVVEKTIDILNELNYLNWQQYKSIIPFFVESLKSLIQYEGSKYAIPLFQIINKILDVLIKEIENDNCTHNDIISLINIIKFVIEEQNKRNKEENKNPIINLERLYSIFLNIIKILIPETLNVSKLKYSKILVLVIDLIHKNTQLYINEFFTIKKIIPNLTKSLYNFCSKLKLDESLIYIGNNPDLKDFNEFIGLSIPKLFLILTQIDTKNNIKIGDKDKSILNLIKKFYQMILGYIKPKKKNSFRRLPVKLFIEKSQKEDITQIINNIENNTFKYMQLAFEQMKKYEQFNKVENESLEKDDKRNSELINILEYKEERKLEFIEMWNKIKLKIIYCRGFEKLHKIIKEEISNERKNFTKSLMNYNDRNKVYTNNILNNKEYNKNLKLNVSFFTTYSKYFIQHYGNDLVSNKNELYFYYWSSIFLMGYDEKRKYFEQNKTQYNKEYFNKDIINFTLKQFHNINYASSNYENLLFIKFFNSYLCELDDKNKENCLIQIINSSEAENLFNLIRAILDKLSNKINFEINKKNNKDDNSEIFGSDNNTKNEEEKGLYFASNLFENDLDEYVQALDFLMHFSENNPKTKDYLRYQNNNNSKNHNFIIILSAILENFIQDDNKKNKTLIDKYFYIIIKILECLTKCCNRTSNDNQDCIVKETNLLRFIKYILDNINYRQKKYSLKEFFSDDESISLYNSEINNNNLIECLTIGLDRKKLSYLKYKLLFFLSILTVGREKADKIYETIHQIIDFNTLINVLVETYKEILIEKNCQNNLESLNFDENILSRNNNPEYDDLSLWNDTISDENFIIFEIGTYSYLLINIYIENLERPSDLDIFNEITEIKDQLRKDKCKIMEKRAVDDTNNFFICLGKIFKNLFSCDSIKNKNEDFFLPKSFSSAYKFYFDYTPEIEIIFKGQIIKYYVKLSPICKCLTRVMKEEFNQNADRTSTKTKLESLFNNVEYFQYQLNDRKSRMDKYQKYPVLDLLFNQYNFYMDVFFIISILINLLIFCSYYRTDDDVRKVDKYSENFEYRYGFLYNKNNIDITEAIIKYSIWIETIFGGLILINYFMLRIPYFTFYKNNIFYNENMFNDKDDNIQEKLKKEDKYYYFKLIISVVINMFRDERFLFHLLLFIFCVLSLIKNYLFITGLLTDIIKRSQFLLMIAIIVWEAKFQLIGIIFFYYLVAYYFSIFIYLFIPDQVPDDHCYSFKECFFTLCDQSIKGSNGIINYLKEEGLFTKELLWGNIRFYIDNLFAIFEYFIVLQIFNAVIIVDFSIKTKEYRRIKKDMNNKCFICGVKKSEISNYYNQLGFNGHIKLDHYLWNYMFAIFNVMKKNKKNLISLDKIIYENYKKRIFKTWIPFKTCKIKSEEDLKKAKQLNYKI